MKQLSVKYFADGADSATIARLAQSPDISGFTTNPTLMRAAGVSDYERFALDILPVTGGRPVSFEVFADEAAEMERQALRIASWGANVYVKIPVTNTRGEPTIPLLRKLARAGVALNVTAVFTSQQVRDTAEALQEARAGYISVFAGRIADTGVDPFPIVRQAVELCRSRDGRLEVIWASARELYNIVQADDAGCHIITLTPDLLKKRSLIGKDLAEYSLETVRMFHADGLAAGFVL
jgi:transaldolase